MSCPADRNIAIKHVKVSKYKYQEIDISKMWGMQPTTVLIIIVLGVINKRNSQIIENILENSSPQKRQKTLLI